MYNSILTNMTSLAIQRNLNNSQVGISTSLKRMSTGIKLNQAKDGAADYVLSRKVKKDITGLDIVSQNVKHGMNLLEIADNTLNNMINKLTTIRNRSLETMNCTLSYEERAAIQREIDELVEEVVREKDTAVYNEKNIFGVEKTEIPDENIVNGLYAYEVDYIESVGGAYIDTGFICNKNDNYSYTMKGDFTTSTGGWTGSNGYLQLSFSGGKANVGYGPSSKELTGDDTITCSYKDGRETLTVNGEHVHTQSWSGFSSKDETIGIFRLGGANHGWVGSASIRGKLSGYQLYKDDELVLDLKPVVDTNGRACMFDNISKQLFYSEASEFQSGPKKIIEPKYDENPYSVSLQIGEDAGANDVIDIELGFNLTNFACDVITKESAQKTLNRVDGLIEALLKRQTNVASAANRLDSISQTQTNELENLKITHSSYVDTDIASESSKMVHSQILQQVSASLFSQANNITGNLALRLLAG